MASVADLNAKIDAIKTSIDVLVASKAVPPVATQADLDALGVKLNAAFADLQAALAAPVPSATTAPAATPAAPAAPAA